MRNEIVVGLDGSPASAEALRWAMAEAEVSGNAVVALHAWMPMAVVAGMGAVVPAVVERPDEADALVAGQLVAAGRDRYPGVSVDAWQLQGSAVTLLLERAKDARMLVVGSGRKSRLGRMVLGSTSEACAHEAACPVIVVPGPRPDKDSGSMHITVAGADGSHNGDAALQWAVAEAQLHHGVMEAYLVVEAARRGQALGQYVLMRRALRQLHHTATRLSRGTDAKVMTQALVGLAGPTLCSAATSADLLVVGRRGRGAIGSLLMGSVADYCVRHAECPVAIIPAPSQDRGR